MDRRIVDSNAVPASPSGLALSPDESRLFVTCAAPESKVCILDLRPREPIHGAKGLGAGFRMAATIPTGHTSLAPAPSPDGKTLYVCNRFNNDVSVIDLAARKEVRRILPFFLRLAPPATHRRSSRTSTSMMSARVVRSTGRRTDSTPRP